MEAIHKDLDDLARIVRDCAKALRDIDSNEYAHYACADHLESFYNGVERILERAFKLSGEQTPTGGDFHMKLLL